MNEKARSPSGNRTSLGHGQSASVNRVYGLTRVRNMSPTFHTKIVRSTKTFTFVLTYSV